MVCESTFRKEGGVEARELLPKSSIQIEKIRYSKETEIERLTEIRP